MMQERIARALELLDLPTLVSRSDIKNRYRQLAKRYHPDIQKDMLRSMDEINEAYALLMEYIESFRYTFDSAEIAKQYPGEEHAKKFRP